MNTSEDVSFSDTFSNFLDERKYAITIPLKEVTLRGD